MTFLTATAVATGSVAAGDHGRNPIHAAGVPEMPMRRRMRGAAAFAAWLALAGAAWAQAPIEVWKTEGCGCCLAWIRILENGGYSVRAHNVPAGRLTELKTAAGIGPGLASCHTAWVEGYVIEGHVPPAEIARLLAERPDAIGLSVPGMPLGSPGMGEPGPGSDSYDVLLVRRDGSTAVFASYPGED